MTYIPMGPPPPPQPPHGLCFGAASWTWGIGEQGRSSNGMEWGDGGGAGLRFLLRFDPEKPGLDRTLLGVSLSALLTRLLGWSKDGGRGRGSLAIVGEEAAIGGSGNAAVSAAALAAAVSLCLAAVYASEQRPRRAPPPPPQLRRRRRRPLPPPDSGARFECSVCFVRVIASRSDGGVVDPVYRGFSCSCEASCSTGARRRAQDSVGQREFSTQRLSVS